MHSLAGRFVLPGLHEHHDYIRRAIHTKRGRGLIFAALLLACMSLLLLAQTGQLATHMYTLGDLEREQQSLRQEIGELEVQLAQLQSIAHLQAAVPDLGLAPAAPLQLQYLVVAAPDPQPFRPDN